MKDSALRVRPKDSEKSAESSGSENPEFTVCPHDFEFEVLQTGYENFGRRFEGLLEDHMECLRQKCVWRVAGGFTVRVAARNRNIEVFVRS